MKKSTFKRGAQYLLVLFLTLGASLTLGLLSMSGFMAVIPIAALGVTSFFLSVMYEGEIYFENLRDAIKGIFDKNFYRLEHTKRLIALILENTPDNELPLLLRQYKNLGKGTSCNHEPESAIDKKRALMEKLFMNVLFNGIDKESDDATKALHEFFNNVSVDDNGEPLTKEKLLSQVKYRTRLTNIAFYLSFAVGAFFGLGTLFLLSEAITILGITAISVAMLPYIVVPLCVFSAVAYSLLIYNTLANIIQNNSLRQWAKDIYHDFSQKPSFASITRGLGAVTLISLGLALTVFTAGTWWTVANNVPKAIPFLKKIPRVVTLVVIPFFTSLGALFFNMENTRASMALFRPKKNKADEIGDIPSLENKDNVSFLSWLSQKFLNGLKAFGAAIAKTFAQDFIIPAKKLKAKENNWQFYNPFRFLLLLIEFPIKIIAFIGHLISIGATTDQIPNVPKWLAMFCSAISEGLEDFHYFFNFEEHGHSHDLPSIIIKCALSPLILFSAIWNFSTSTDSFSESWQKSWTHQWYNEQTEPKKRVIKKEPGESRKTAKALAIFQVKEKINDYQHDAEKQGVYKAIYQDIKSDNDGIKIKTLLSQFDDKQSHYMSTLKKQRSRFFQPSTTSSEDFIVELKTTLTSDDCNECAINIDGDPTVPFSFVNKSSNN